MIKYFIQDHFFNNIFIYMYLYIHIYIYVYIRKWNRKVNESDWLSHEHSVESSTRNILQSRVKFQK